MAVRAKKISELKPKRVIYKTEGKDKTFYLLSRAQFYWMKRNIITLAKRGDKYKRNLDNHRAYSRIRINLKIKEVNRLIEQITNQLENENSTGFRPRLRS